MRMIMADRFTASTDIEALDVFKKVSIRTIGRRIRESGEFKSYWAARKPFLRPVNKTKRLAWCKARVNWSAEQWLSVLWSDESPYTLRFKAKRRVWRRHNERYDKKCIVHTVKHDMKINVWGCFAGHGVGSITRVMGNMDQHQYMSILEHEMLPSARNLFGSGPWSFQQDNDPKHTAINTRNWLTEHKVSLLEWPAQSPDLNPIENLWSILDQRCAKRSPNNEEELFEALQEEWYNLPVDMLTKLACSMPRRCQAVIDAEGGMTKY